MIIDKYCRNARTINTPVSFEKFTTWQTDVHHRRTFCPSRTTITTVPELPLSICREEKKINTIAKGFQRARAERRASRARSLRHYDNRDPMLNVPRLTGQKGRKLQAFIVGNGDEGTRAKNGRYLELQISCNRAMSSLSYKINERLFSFFFFYKRDKRGRILSPCRIAWKTILIVDKTWRYGERGGRVCENYSTWHCNLISRCAKRGKLQ